MIHVGIIGSTGYTGVELVRILKRHPEVEIVSLSSHSYAGQKYTEIYPDKTGYIDLICEEQNTKEIFQKIDAVFLALPHGHAVEVAREGLNLGKPVIDLGADFRFQDKDTYEKWYNVEHSGGDILEQAKYCLPEINRKEIPGTKIVGNPGCYPTSIILGLAPLLENSLIDPKTLIIDSKSGVSGAGRKLALGSHFAEVNENVNAYGIGVHRHTPEIEAQLSKISGQEITVSFTPHLMPMTRGILSTIYASVKEGVTEEILRKAYEDKYTEEAFVHVLPQGVYPHTKWAYGSNNCYVNFKYDPRTNRVVIVSAIDNLVKGASGQAVQNMNILFDLPETLGLEGAPVYP